MHASSKVLLMSCALMLAACVATPPPEPDPMPSPDARDPGPRSAGGSAGGPIEGLKPEERALFDAGLGDFAETEVVTDGLGPTMNLDGCAGCHLAPTVGGSSPAVNPQIAFATREGARNRVPSFLRADGPVREVRFVKDPKTGEKDGGVHSLFSIAGRKDAPGCELAQFDFEVEHARRNLIFRIPTPVFGAGLIEQIPDSEIVRNFGDESAQKRALGIRGRTNIVLPFHTITGLPNKNGNDGTIGRFGWKAQNKSLLVFSGEAYNVEMGITNEAFPTEREEDPKCQFAQVPNSITDLSKPTLKEGLSSIEKFSFFMRFLAPPEPSQDLPGGADSINRGRAVFGRVGCQLCHAPVLHTGDSRVEALRNKRVPLYSDLLVHDMGSGLADGVQQGQAGPSEFRSAPLWGLGQRLFFLHDGRTADLREAVRAHFSPGSEANEVVKLFYRQPAQAQQDLYNFLRSL